MENLVEGHFRGSLGGMLVRGYVLERWDIRKMWNGTEGEMDEMVNRS
jgi:hypothetical protein